MSAIKDGFFGLTPILIVGSLFLLLATLPISGYPEFMEGIFGSGWMDMFYLPYQATFSFMAVFVIVGIAKSLSEDYQLDSKFATVLSLVAVFLLTPVIANEEGVKGLMMNNLGAAGLFISIFATFITVEIYRFCIERNITIKMPDSVPPFVSNAFAAVVPAFFVLLLFTAITIGFKSTSFGTAQQFIFTFLQQPLQSLGGTLPSTVFVLLLESLLWSLGIHGSSVVSIVMRPIWYALSAENLAAAEAGLVIPNIVNFQFIAHYVKIGGTGATLGLNLLCIFKAKSSQYKVLGKLSIGASIFNINEPIIFGFPLVLNPIMLVPFIFANILVGILTYAVIFFGIVPYINGAMLPTTIPIIFSGFMMGGWRGALFQVFLVAITTLVYYPFFVFQDKLSYEEEQETLLNKTEGLSNA